MANPTLPKMTLRVMRMTRATAANKISTKPKVSRVSKRSLSFLLFSLPLPKLFKAYSPGVPYALGFSLQYNGNIIPFIAFFINCKRR